MRMHSAPASAALMGLFTLVLPAMAQEAMFTQAATMPSPGGTIVRNQFMWYKYGSNPESGADRIDKLEASTIVAYGIDRGWAAYLEVPVAHVRTDHPDGDDGHLGIDDVDMMVKWRCYQKDTGGVDTVRVALFGGVELSFEDSFSANPMIGGVVTMVRGRHGFNQDLSFRLNTDGDEEDNLGGEGPAEAIAFNTSYLYRIEPARFTSTSTGAWYVTAELNGLYETNGDIELRWAPGLMFEGREFAFEVMLQFPLWSEVEHRAELDMAIGFGFRFLF